MGNDEIINVFVVTNLVMDFSDIISRFDIRELLTSESSILGQTGYLMVLENSVAYLYEETRGSGFARLYFDNNYVELTSKEINKLHSLIRLQRIESRDIKPQELWIYSTAIEKTMQNLLEERPDLRKGSTQLAFLPKNYTRFTESLLFDFDYIYDDFALCEEIDNFDTRFTNRVNAKTAEITHDMIPEGVIDTNYSDDQLYRYLIDKVRELRISINGKLSPPQLLVALFEYSTEIQSTRVCINLGASILFLKTDEQLQSIMTRKTVSKLNTLAERGYTILQPDRDLLDKLLERVDIPVYT